MKRTDFSVVTLIKITLLHFIAYPLAKIIKCIENDTKVFSIQDVFHDLVIPFP